MRPIFRFLCYAFLAITVFVAVIDATRTIGASTMTLTSVGESWDLVAPGSRLAFAALLADNANTNAGTSMLATVSQWPTLVVAGILTVLFAYWSRPPRRRRMRLTGD